MRFRVSLFLLMAVTGCADVEQAYPGSTHPASLQQVPLASDAVLDVDQPQEVLLGERQRERQTETETETERCIIVFHVSTLYSQ